MADGAGNNKQLQRVEAKINQLQRQLEKEKHRNRILFDNTGTATCIFGDDSVITLCNKEFQRLSGYSKEEIEGKMKWTEFVDKSELDRMRKYHEQRMKGEGTPPEEYQFVLVTRKGEKKNIHLNIGVVEETKERVASLTDITPQKSIQSALEESHRVMETLIANLPGMVYRCKNTEDWPMEYISDGCYDITGYRPAELIHSEVEFADLIHPEDKEIVWQKVQETIRDKIHFEIEYRVYNKKGELRWFWERGKVVGVNSSGTEFLEGFIMDITESKLDQEALIESEEKYRLLAETARDLICIHNMEGNITYLNTSALSFLDVNEEVVLGKNIEEFIPPEDIEALYERKNQRQKGIRDKLVYETVFINLKGEKLPVEVSSSAISKNGEITGMLLIARDITERKKAEKEIKESEKRYRALFETTGTATVVYDSNKVVRMCNRKFEELYGKDRSEIINQITWEVFAHRDDLPWMKEYHRLRGKGATNIPTEYEFTFVNAHGEERVVYHTVKILEDTKERIASFADITALKEAETALKMSEERLKLAIEGGELGLWDWNVGTGKVFFNKQWAQMLGFNPEELEPVEGTWRMLLHPDDWPQVEELLQEHLEGNSRRYVAEYRIKTKSGDYKWISDMGRVVSRKANGKAQRMVGTHKDITERKQAEIKLRNWNKELEERVKLRTSQLEETNRELESFSYSVSHDLKAPLRAIDGFSRVLEDDYVHQLNGEAKRYLGIIRTNITKMNQLITDLLAFSRLGRKSLRIQHFDTKELVYEVYNEQKNELGNHRFVVKDLPELHADKMMMKIVFSNLISNAFKFSAGRSISVVEVGSFEQNNKKILYIKDNGVGFNMDYGSKVFDTFQRLHHESDFKGSGIGLSLVHKVIQKHEGQIWYAAKENKGATFYFSLNEIDNNKKNK